MLLLMIVLYFFQSLMIVNGNQCPSFRTFFSRCTVGSPNFDECLTAALNDVRPCLKVGDKSLNIPVLEPITYSAPVTGVVDMGILRGVTNLSNIVERAWANSTYYKTKTNIKEGKVEIYQILPYKILWGNFDSDAVIMDLPIQRSGTWKVELFDVKQKTTIQLNNVSKKVKVSLLLLSVRDIKLQLKNIIHDEQFEELMNRNIHRFWRILFEMFRPTVYDLINQAQTNLGNEIYQKIKLAKLFEPEDNEVRRRRGFSGNSVGRPRSSAPRG